MGIGITNQAMMFADKLKSLLETHRIDAPELSRVLSEKYGKKISGQTVYNYLNKPEVQPRLDVAMAIAKEFDVSIEYLADDSLDEPPTKRDLTESETMILDACRDSGMKPYEIMRLLFDSKKDS